LVFEMFDEISFYEFHQIVKKIVGQDEYERNKFFVENGYNPERMIMIS